MLLAFWAESVRYRLPSSLPPTSSPQCLSTGLLSVPSCPAPHSPSLSRSLPAVWFSTETGELAAGFCCLPVVELRLLVQMLGISHIPRAISCQIFSIPYSPNPLVIYFFSVNSHATGTCCGMCTVCFAFSPSERYRSVSCEVIQCRMIS